MQDNVKCSLESDVTNLVQKSSPVSVTPKQLSGEDLSAAVRGFVVASDRDLLLSNRKEVAKRHRCYICGMDFAIARVYETHKILEHQFPAEWKCSECGMQFIHGAMYNSHMTRSHSIKPYVCGFDGCPAVFHCKIKLKGHRHRHQAQRKPKGMKEKEKVFKCEFCSLEFPLQSKLTLHLRKHTGEQPYKCPHCPSAFKYTTQRLRHVQTVHVVNRVRKYLCDWCGKKFFSSDHLRKHVRIHTGEKPYTCPVCSRSFCKSTTMRIHLRQHTGEKPYVCDQCGQSFTVRVSLRTHLKSKHNIIVDTDVNNQHYKSEAICAPPVGQPERNNDVKPIPEENRDNMGIVTLNGPAQFLLNDTAQSRGEDITTLPVLNI